MNWLYNKNIVLSGASSGIGKELTLILTSKYNCKVLGLARTESKLQALKDEISKVNNNFDYYPMDISSEQSWIDLATYLGSTNFAPDILINNAGTMTPFEAYKLTSKEQVEKVFNTNFFSVTHAIRHILPLLEKSNNPAIINISSASALACLPGVSVYSASKSALKTFSEILHCELRSKVYVSTIMPGFVKTNLFFSKDNNHDIITQKDKKIIDFFSMQAPKMAKKIIRVIKRKKARAIIGTDAKFINMCYKLTPQTSGRFMGWVMRKSKLKTFEDVYEKENKNGNNN